MAGSKFAIHCPMVACVANFGLKLGSWFQIDLFAGEDSSANSTVRDSAIRDLYLGIYGGLGFGQAVSIVIGSVFLYLATLQGSKRLHDNILSNVLRLPMSYFDTTPKGRILNRFVSGPRDRDGETLTQMREREALKSV